MRSLLLGSLLAIGALAGCSEDTALPAADEEVKVRTDTFFPNEVTVLPGRRVRWVNVLARTADNVRTVTSGTGPDDPEKGLLFEATLQGYESGDPVGEAFVHTFPEIGSFPYFSYGPDSTVFTGRVIVQ